MHNVAKIDTLQNAIQHSRNWQRESSCRFVFIQFLMPISPVSNRVVGILFYTYTHYGHNWIEFNQTQLRSIETKCTATTRCNQKESVQTLLEDKSRGNVSERTVINIYTFLAHTEC